MQQNGPDYIRVVLRTRGVAVARYGHRLSRAFHCHTFGHHRSRLVRDIMHEHAPDGFDTRFPGKKVALVRRPLTAIGPFHEVSSDGHEKLGCQALAMGEIGLPIYAYKDKWSDALLKISVVPNCRSAGAIGHLYLDLVEQIGGENFTYRVDSGTDHQKGIPIQATTDKGSEIGWQYAFQDALR